ncbi:SDR family NAD(P)-dependent oxidoreductase [Chachezhania sediminis]|uniref:SDR family NAD(P)-dependent oxidoreductase n=1 Tax=Chachezhania sediminis TaxID=2599291 RepID=UPI00131D1ED0|nr:SDR family oxidoreductase [Chachezhania sediminis]
MDRLKDKVALITGAGTGVGRACMEIFAKEGAKVVGVSRTQGNLDEALKAVTDAGGEGAVVAADLATPEGAQKAVDGALAAFGRIDVLVNSAGVGYSFQDANPGTMEDTVNTTPDAWHKVLAINLDSGFYMCRLVIPLMQKQGGGSIVNVTSISGYQGLPGAHTYTAAKGGMINLTRSLCVAYAKDGIRANAIAPGFIATRMVESFLPLFEDEAVAESITPMRRPGTPEEMAYGCLYLASDEAGYCNGTILTIDGGTTARQ